MPNEYFTMGTGPQGLHLGLTLTAAAPATVSDTNPIVPGMPLKFAKTTIGSTPLANSQILGRVLAFCAEGDVPECYAIAREQRANFPVGVRMIPRSPGRTGAVTNAVDLVGASYVDQLRVYYTTDITNPASATAIRVKAGKSDSTYAGAGTNSHFWALTADGSGVGQVVAPVSGGAASGLNGASVSNPLIVEVAF